MSEPTVKPKRKTWRDRRCAHGNTPEWRAEYDIVTCNEPGCFDLAGKRLGLQSIPKAPDPRLALYEEMRDAVNVLVAALEMIQDHHGSAGTALAMCAAKGLRESKAEALLRRADEIEKGGGR